MSESVITPDDVQGWGSGLGKEIHLLVDCRTHYDDLVCCVSGQGKRSQKDEVLLFLSCANLLLVGTDGKKVWHVERADLSEWVGRRAEVYEL